MLKFAELLEAWWPAYVAAASGPIPVRHWRAVEAVLSCRTPRRGGHVHLCAQCSKHYFQYHSCNHRSCPSCGAAKQQEWSAKQEARLLPVPYYLVTLTVPEPLRPVFLKYPKELYPIFFSEAAAALQLLFANPKFVGGQAGFIAVLHTWTRRMLHHPHLHLLVPAVALAGNGCSLRHPRNEEFLVHAGALANAFRRRLQAALDAHHPELLAMIEPKVWRQDWVAQCKPVGRGRSALRYLAAYVQKSAFTESRLAGMDSKGRVLLRYRDSQDGKWKIEPIEPLELIRRWLLHALPKGLVRMRHYGWLSAAAHKAFLRIRFLLGLYTYRRPVAPPKPPPHCPCCNTVLIHVARISPQRGPPLSRQCL
jgi:hypothetical protein